MTQLEDLKRASLEVGHRKDSPCIFQYCTGKGDLLMTIVYTTIKADCTLQVSSRHSLICRPGDDLTTDQCTVGNIRGPGGYHPVCWVSHLSSMSNWSISMNLGQVSHLVLLVETFSMLMEPQIDINGSVHLDFHSAMQ